MNLNPMTWFRGSKAPAPSGGLRRRKSAPQGPWSATFDGWVARTVAPRLYEALREAIPPIDAAINRLVSLDGIIRPVAESDRLERAIRDWMDNVQVNDLAAGFQAFYQLQNNELYEQGQALGEMTLAADGRDVARLWVGDSKGVYFRRAASGILETWYRAPSPERNTRMDGTEQLERVLRGAWRTGDVGALGAAGYRHLDPRMLVYAAYNPEADSPYGVSLMRSMEFVAKTLLTIDNATQQVWERFGNPAFALTYKRARKPPANDPELTKMRQSLAANLAEVLEIKRRGNSADFVNAIAKDDDLSIEIIGGDGQVLEIETPARHILEQIVAKTGLPSWMLGFHWSTAERLAERQGELVLQESRTRFEGRTTALRRVVATALRARGVTWKDGEWALVQELPSLQDLVAKAQARFLEAQTELMLSGAATAREGGSGPKLAAVDLHGGIVFPTDPAYPRAGVSKAALAHACKAAGGESYVEDEAALMRLERRVERALLSAWHTLRDDVLDVLGLTEHAKSTDLVWTFDDTLLADLRALEKAFVARVGGDDAALASSAFDAWLRGVANGAAELGADEVVEAMRAATRRSMSMHALEQVRDTTALAYREGVLEVLESGAYDGLNPRAVARELSDRFDAQGYNWERLARSEIADAQAAGKLAQYAAHEVEEYDFVPAGDACPVCQAMAAGGPYTVGTGPRPVHDTHPNCRCTIAARVP